MLKQCFKCGKVLALAEFYKHPKMSDEHLNKCKNCCKKDTMENRLKNREYYREYDKNRARDPKRIQAQEKYRKTEAGKKAVYQATKNYRAKHPERQKIYRDCEKTLNNPRACSQCGSNIMVEAHHDNYNESFKVRWLCRSCHRQVLEALTQTEQDLERTRKALDVAKDTFNWIDETYRTGQETEAEIWGKVQLAAQKITALEQKDVK